MIFSQLISQACLYKYLTLNRIITTAPRPATLPLQSFTHTERTENLHYSTTNPTTFSKGRAPGLSLSMFYFTACILSMDLCLNRSTVFEPIEDFERDHVYLLLSRIAYIGSIMIYYW